MDKLILQFQKNVKCLSKEKAEALLLKVVELTRNQTTPFFQELLRILYFRVFGTASDVFFGASIPGVFSPSEKLPGKYSIVLPVVYSGYVYMAETYGIVIKTFTKGTIGINASGTGVLRYRIYLQNEGATATYYPYGTSPYEHPPFGTIIIDGITEATLIDAVGPDPTQYLTYFPPDYISTIKNSYQVYINNETNIHIDKIQ